MSPTKDNIIQIKEGTFPPLYCLHSVSGSASFYRHLDLPTDQAVYGISAEDAENEWNSCTTIEEMATKYISDLSAIGHSDPEYLCGFSMGGLIAYEMATQLKSRGKNIAFLGLIDTQIPDDQSEDAEPPQTDKAKWLTFLNIVCEGIEPWVYREDIPFWKLSEKDRLKAILEWRDAGLAERLAKSVDEALLNKFYSFYCTQLNAAQTYHLPKTDLDVFFFIMSEDRNNRKIELLEKSTSGNVSVNTIPGTHFNLFIDLENAKELGRQMASCINRK
jgi:thioesterase domain-containing protein